MWGAEASGGEGYGGKTRGSAPRFFVLVFGGNRHGL